jgi:hypothetical protein
MLKGCALTFSPPTFSLSDNSTHTVGPSDDWSAVHIDLVTVRPSPNPKVEDLFIKPKNEHLYSKVLEQLSQCDNCSHKSFSQTSLWKLVPSIFSPILANPNCDFGPMFFESLSPRLWTCCHIPPWPLTIIHSAPYWGVLCHQLQPPKKSCDSWHYEFLVQVTQGWMVTTDCWAVDPPPVTSAL